MKYTWVSYGIEFLRKCEYDVDSYMSYMVNLLWKFLYSVGVEL